MLYELTTLSIRLGTAGRVIEGIGSWTSAPENKGHASRLLGD